MSKTAQNETERVKNPSSLPRETLLSHLMALRKVLVVSGIAIGICFVIIFFGFSQMLMDFLRAPLVNRNVTVVYTAIAESLTTQMKASLIAGVIAASPVVIFQIWTFLKPALYPQEGKLFVGLFFIALTLFIVGVVFAYVIVFNMAITFFLITGEGIATPMISIESYVNFLFSFILPFGLMFEMPIAMIILTNMGIVSVSSFTKVRKYVIFAIFVAAAILTPPDVLSQVLLGTPLVILYEAGILAARVAEKRRARNLGKAA